MAEYSCSFCGKKGVKLWRPSLDIEPLICAECAEKLQAEQKFEETVWTQRGNRYETVHTGKILDIPKWEISEDGTIPVYEGTINEKAQYNRSEILPIELNGKKVTMIPAFESKEGGFWVYSNTPEEAVKNWKKLPTK